jgi:hypothetical protein
LSEIGVNCPPEKYDETGETKTTKVYSMLGLRPRTSELPRRRGRMYSDPMPSGGT